MRGNKIKAVWLKKALDNLDKEAEFIALENPQAARVVVANILAAVQQLALNPALGKPGRIMGTRELILADVRYIIPYRVKTKEARVEILRVFHSSRKRPERW